MDRWINKPTIWMQYFVMIYTVPISFTRIVYRKHSITVFTKYVFPLFVLSCLKLNPCDQVIVLVLTSPREITFKYKLNPLEFVFYNGGSIIFCNTRRVPLMEQDMLTLPEQLPHFNSCSILVFQLLSFLFFYDYVCTADLYTECPNITSDYLGTHHPYFILIEENTICSIYSYQVELLHPDTIFHSLFVKLPLQKKDSEG